ncbi:FixH family protein [Rhodobacteraceae bacterium KMM 6894]|nr:FixH family protein [Rhodobacteraceae bacterium KMM 6894]
MAQSQNTEWRLTGWHVLMGFVGAFGVIIAVNLTLAYNAVRTFPGLEVKNSYVASQEFDVRRDAQEALGWTVRASHHDGMLKLAITNAAGAPVRVARLDAILGRATTVKDDMTPDFVFNGIDYNAPVDLGAGNWNIRMEAQAMDGTDFYQRLVLIKE